VVFRLIVIIAVNDVCMIDNPLKSCVYGHVTSLILASQRQYLGKGSRSDIVMKPFKISHVGKYSTY